MKVFKEYQRFNQWWLVLLLIIVFLVLVYSLFKEFGRINQNDVTEVLSLIATAVITILAYSLIFSLKLKTRIDEKGITYQFSPIHFKPKGIPWRNISKCYVREYSPILEYGGWGLRGLFRSKLLRMVEKGKAYNVRGRYGIQLELIDGSKILIGTQKIEQAKEVVRNYTYKVANTKKS